MSNFSQRARDLGRKAAQLKAALEQAPATVAQVRETVAATTGQLQQLRAEVQTSINGLRADTQGSLSAALQEISADLTVYLEAGYEVTELDLEVSPIERLLVHLYKLEDVHPSQLRALMVRTQTRRTTHAILSALLQARTAAEKVDVSNMDQAEVLIGIGPSPSVRICWHARTQAASEPPPPLPAAIVEQSAVSTSPAPRVGPSLSSYSSSYFESRPAAAPAPSSAPSAAAPVAATPEPVADPVRTHSSAELLAKYKSSPHFSKYRR